MNIASTFLVAAGLSLGSPSMVLAQCDFNAPPPVTDVPDSSFVDSNGDGIDGMRCGPIFVSTSGSDLNPGTIDAPMRSINAAILAAASYTPARSVYVARGTYNETIVLRGGVSVYGGFNAATGWSRSGVQPIVAGTTSVGCYAPAISAPVTLSALRIVGGATGVAGASSVGLVVQNGGSNLITIASCSIEGGTPGAGASGTTGAAGTAGGNGNAGQNGCDGCSSNGAGGLGAPAGGGNGGLGGYGSGNGANGSDGTNSPGGGGRGGNSESQCFVQGSPGGVGARGATGAGGAPGVSASSPYALAAGAGGQGSVGNGGGGGGGGGGGDGASFTCHADRGGGGGGGGSGGSGGLGGSGGGSGGSSIGVLIQGTGSVSLLSTYVLTASGMNGGAGGMGGPGGSGGSGAAGGVGADDSGPGGAGGNGGAGGAGGQGGGGAGGSAVCMMYGSAAATPLVGTGNTFVFGAPGNGGAGGTGPGVAGLAGVLVQAPVASPVALPNDPPPFAVHARAITSMNTEVTFTPLVAAPPSAGPYTFAALSSPMFGTLAIVGTEFHYMPNPEFTGIDTVQIQATDMTNRSQIVNGIALISVISRCVGDFDHNGTVAVADIFAFLNAWFAGSPAADVDGRPGVQINDIFAFLGAWFAGC